MSESITLPAPEELAEQIRQRKAELARLGRLYRASLLAKKALSEDQDGDEEEGLG